MSKINKEAEKIYINDGGIYCPFCGSENLSADNIEADDKIAWCYISCTDCDEVWLNEYTLSLTNILTFTGVDGVEEIL